MDPHENPSERRAPFPLALLSAISSCLEAKRRVGPFLFLTLPARWETCAQPIYASRNFSKMVQFWSLTPPKRLTPDAPLCRATLKAFSKSTVWLRSGM
jgi:hypothetical protein